MAEDSDELADADELTGAEITERTARAYLDQRVEALETQLESVTRTRDILRAELSYVRHRLGIFSRAVQVWVLLRGAIRHPSRLPEFGRRVVRVLTSPMTPPQAPIAEFPRPSPAELAVERRAALTRSFRERVLATGPERSVGDLRIAIVADEELVENLAPDCRLISLRADDWRSRLREERPDLLLVESAWRGAGGTWQYRIGWHGHPESLEQAELRALLDWSREQDVPSVFWHTAAAHQASRFRHTAVQFDHIAATSADAAAVYEAAAERTAAAVSVAPHAVQPRRHNPAAASEVTAPDGPAFVGSWDPALPLMQRELLEATLDAGLEYGLTVYDRRLGAQPGGFAFPNRFQPHVAGWVPTDRLPDVYRQHRVIVDAWTDGGGSVPARLLEALASGTPVVAASTDPASSPLLAQFGTIARHRTELHAAIGALLDDDGVRSHVRLAAPGAVYRQHTYAHRVAAIAREVGYRVSVAQPSVSVAAVAGGNADDVAARAIDVAQEIGASEVLVGVTDWDVAAAPAPGVRIVEQRSDMATSERIRRLAAVAASEWIAILADPRAGMDIGASTLAALKFADADVIGVATPDGADRSGHAYTNGVAADAALVRRAVLLERGWPAPSDGALDVMSEWSAAGVRFYAVPAARPPVAAR